MGKKKSPKMAAIPDVNALANKQFAQQKQSALEALTANRANQTNQFGSINWSRDPTSGAWTQTEKYNPEQQALLDTQIKNQGQMGQMAGDVLGAADMTYSGAPAMPTVGGYNQQSIDTIRALQAPDLARRQNAGNAALAAQGLSTGGGKAWESAQSTMNDAASRADMNAILAGINQGNTEFGQGMQGRQQYVGEQNQMLQNAGGMMSGATPKDLRFGSYAQQGTVNAPNYAQNALTAQGLQQAQNNAKAASKGGGFLGSLGGIAGSVLGGMAGPMGSAIGGSIGSNLFGGGAGGAGAYDASTWG